MNAAGVRCSLFRVVEVALLRARACFTFESESVSVLMCRLYAGADMCCASVQEMQWNARPLHKCPFQGQQSDLDVPSQHRCLCILLLPNRRIRLDTVEEGQA